MRPIHAALLAASVLVLAFLLSCRDGLLDDGGPVIVPTVQSIPDQTAYAGLTFYLNLAVYVHHEAEASFALSYRITAGPGTMDGPFYSHTFADTQHAVVEFTVEGSGGGSASGSFMIDVISVTPEPLSFPPDYVFVSTTGSDLSDGQSVSSPFRTITHAIEEALQDGKSAVVVACGVYVESIGLADGISLLGGYDPGFTRRDTDGLKAVIRSDNTQHYTILADSIQGPTVVEGFVVQGPDSMGSGQTSSVIHIIDSSASLEIRECILHAGRGGDGSRGADGEDGEDGSPGVSGSDSFETDTQSLAACWDLQTTPVSGGSGGELSYDGNSISGGEGAFSECPSHNSQQPPAGDGFGSYPGLRGNSGHNRYNSSPACSTFLTGGFPATGSNGTDGGSGYDGMGGSGGAGWTIVDSRMVSGGGNPGTDGSPGSGGGGGGAGGGVDIDSECASGYDTLGPSGGGGGSGAHPGGGGQGGTGGGSVFGVFIHNTQPTSSLPRLSDCVIYCGRAGKGGDGGSGGVGGRGGHGADGGIADGPYSYAMGNPGRGGDGGDGGHGGGGGGGAGGHSTGVFVTLAGAVDPDYSLSNTIETGSGLAGSGGFGGKAMRWNGLNGANGMVTAVLVDDGG